LLEDGNDLAIGKTGRLHAEFPKNLSLKNSTFKRDHLLGGLPLHLRKKRGSLDPSLRACSPRKVTSMPLRKFADI